MLIRILLIITAMCIRFTICLAAEPLKFKVMFVNSNKLKVGENIINRGDTIDENDVIHWDNNKQVIKVLNLQNKNEKFVFTATDAQHVSENSVKLYADYLRKIHSGFKQQRTINTFERNHLSGLMPLPPGPTPFVALLDTLEICIPSQETLNEIRDKRLHINEIREIMYQFHFSGNHIVDDFFFGRDSDGKKMLGSGISIAKEIGSNDPFADGIGKLLITKEIYKNDSPADGLLRLLIDYGSYREEYDLYIHPVSSDIFENE